MALSVSSLAAVVAYALPLRLNILVAIATAVVIGVWLQHLRVFQEETAA